MTERHVLFDRIGKFIVKRDTLNQLPDWLREVMANVVVLQIEYKWESDAHLYTVASDKLPAILPGTYAPTYSIVTDGGRFSSFQLRTSDFDMNEQPRMGAAPC